MLLRSEFTEAPPLTRKSFPEVYQSLLRENHTIVSKRNKGLHSISYLRSGSATTHFRAPMSTVLILPYHAKLLFQRDKAFSLSLRGITPIRHEESTQNRLVPGVRYMQNLKYPLQVTLNITLPVFHGDNDP